MATTMENKKDIEYYILKQANKTEYIRYVYILESRCIK